MRGADRKGYPDRLGWGEAWGGSSPARSARLEAEFLRLLGAHLGSISLGRKEDDGRVARGHRTDYGAFYLLCVLSLESVEAFLGAGLGVGWIITTMSVCILGMGWWVGRRMGVVWRWVFWFGICRFDACGVVGQYSVRLVASGLASCQRCVDPVHQEDQFVGAGLSEVYSLRCRYWNSCAADARGSL